MKNIALNFLFVLILTINALCWDEEPNRLPTKCESKKALDTLELIIKILIKPTHIYFIIIPTNNH